MRCKVKTVFRNNFMDKVRDIYNIINMVVSANMQFGMPAAQ